jgi:hypothetical protein
VPNYFYNYYLIFLMANQANPSHQVQENERHLALAHVAVNPNTGAVTVISTVDENGETHDLGTAEQIQLQNAIANEQAMYTNQMDSSQFQLLLSQPHFSPLPGLADTITGVKRTLEQAYGTDYSQLAVDALLHQGANKRMRRASTDQELKRHKYDVLRSFFRLYFRSEPGTDSMVLKEAINTLYEKKIPAHARIARNAMFRHMWSWYKNQIAVFQSNYREYIKGLKLVKAPTPYPELEADEAMLRSIGIEELYDFSEDDLISKTENSLTDESQQMMQSNHNVLAADEHLGQVSLPVSNTNTAVPTRASSPQHKPFGLATEYIGETTILQYLDQLEVQAKNVLAVIGEIRSKVTRALQHAPQNQ